MNPDWKIVAERMFPPLNSSLCWCDYDKVWTRGEDGSLSRRLVKQCSRCAALDVYREAIKAEVRTA